MAARPEALLGAESPEFGSRPLVRAGGTRLDADPPGPARVLQRVGLRSRAMDVLRGPRVGWTGTVLCAHVHRVGALERFQPQGALTREHWRPALACPAGRSRCSRDNDAERYPAVEVDSDAHCLGAHEGVYKDARPARARRVRHEFCRGSGRCGLLSCRRITTDSPQGPLLKQHLQIVAMSMRCSSVYFWPEVFACEKPSVGPLA